MPDMDETHSYICQINLEKVTVTRPVTTSRGFSVNETPGRTVKTEAVKTTLRSASLDGLRRKVEGYMQLVDDEDFGPATGGVTRGADD